VAFLIDPKLFASNLKYFRERQSYTIKELADRTYLTAAALRSLESGTLVPTEHQLTAIASVLMVKREELILPRPPGVEYYERGGRLDSRDRTGLAVAGLPGLARIMIPPALTWPPPTRRPQSEEARPSRCIYAIRQRPRVRQ